MFEKIQSFWAKRLWRRLITDALATLYGENGWDYEQAVGTLTPNPTGLGLLRTYVVMGTAAQLQAPMNTADIETALERYYRSAAHADTERFTELADTHRLYAQSAWLLRQHQILRGKLAHQRDEYDFSGSVYEHEHSALGPIEPALREKLRTLTTDMAELQQKIDAAELDELKDSDPERYTQRIEERDAEALEKQDEARKDRETDLELAGLLANCELKINTLIGGNSPTVVSPASTAPSLSWNEAVRIVGIVQAALQEECERFHPVSALKGYSIRQIDSAMKLHVANEVLISGHRADFSKFFEEGLKLYGGAVMSAMLTFVADEDVNKRGASVSFPLIDEHTRKINPEFADIEQTESFGQFCLAMGADNPAYWQKVYERIGLRYGAHAPQANFGLNPSGSGA